MKNILQIFTSRKMLSVFIAGFSSGLPLVLSGATLQAWMATEKVDLKVIGLFSLVGLPYTVKFLWSPLMDRYVPPILGRRRGWMLICQILTAITIAMMAFTSPVNQTPLVALLAFLLSFFSASQDIVIDAYRTEVLPSEERGIGSGLYIMGYRLAMIVAGALALILSDHIPWKSVYLIMAAFMIVGVINTLVSTEPEVAEKPPSNFKESVIDPFVDYFKRRGALEILAFIILYKLGDVLAGALSTPFMLELGFSKTQIGTVTKGFGLFATVFGAVFGGVVMYRYGLYKSLWLFGILQAVSNLVFIWLAHVGNNLTVMTTAIAIENLSSGMGTAAFSAFMMSLCNKKFTATQFALLTSLMAVSRVFVSSGSGVMAQNLGWKNYYIVCTLFAIPGLLLLLRYHKWDKPSEGEPLPAGADAD